MEYDALDQLPGGCVGTAAMTRSAAKVATAAVAAAMALEDEGMSDSTAGVLRELRASGIFTPSKKMFTDLPDLATTTVASDSAATEVNFNGDLDLDLGLGELEDLDTHDNRHSDDELEDLDLPEECH
jgi:hypothetical protein